MKIYNYTLFIRIDWINWFQIRQIIQKTSIFVIVKIKFYLNIIILFKNYRKHKIIKIKNYTFLWIDCINRFKIQMIIQKIDKFLFLKKTFYIYIIILPERHRKHIIIKIYNYTLIIRIDWINRFQIRQIIQKTSIYIFQKNVFIYI